MKAKKNSRDKGGRGERAAAKAFGGWWGTDFARTPSSGGFATQRFRDDWNAAGDLVTPDPSFPFCVECKWVEDWSMEQLLRNDGCLIFKWWQQAIGECPADKLPFLVFKRNNHPFYCMIEADDLPSEQFLKDNDIRYFSMPIQKAVVGTYPMKVYIMVLTDFFKSEPEEWQRNKANLVANRQERLSYPPV
jgi:hypothetical protein